MTTNSQTKAKIFLEGLHSDQSLGTFEHLKGLVEALESKNDPDPIEMRLVENIYAFLEKLSVLESNIEQYSKDVAINTGGSKLAELYGDISETGDLYRD